MKRHAPGRRLQPSASHGTLWAVSLSFLVGVGLGVVASGHISAQTADTLSTYLQGYIVLEPSAPSTVLPAMLALYLRYPLLAFALGFLPLGVVLVPLLGVVFGFFLSFSVCALVMSLGTAGVWVGLALFGLRCLVSVVCFFFLAHNAMEAAFKRLNQQAGYGQGDWICLGICLGSLLLGIYLEYLYGASCLRMVLTWWEI